jgi:two-component system, chemotaxis family, chemotaxis protein CheY
MADKLIVEGTNNILDQPMGSLSRLNILIVDDSLHIRRLLDVMLRQMGCQHLFETKTIAQATTILETKPIDVAIVDWILDDPEGDGLSLIKSIRSSPLETVKFLPIIMMTGHTERENIELARDMGVTEFMAKPFTAKNLHARLGMLIDNPRPYVKTRAFFGPDRRRREAGPNIEGERRHIMPRKST